MVLKGWRHWHFNGDLSRAIALVFFIENNTVWAIFQEFCLYLRFQPLPCEKLCFSGLDDLTALPAGLVLGPGTCGKRPKSYLKNALGTAPKSEQSAFKLPNQSGLFARGMSDLRLKF
jgi:hypothetical protein